ncbi:hypothetical protein KSP40_PGU008140 [Platanthera guangdongensis]|uniref:Ribosomal protein L33 n=1 Tax=Platanthera guangdongensis TaxID=2320717 RepID=A0ABR2MP95_9ASPA
MRKKATATEKTRTKKHDLILFSFDLSGNVGKLFLLSRSNREQMMVKNCGYCAENHDVLLLREIATAVVFFFPIDGGAEHRTSSINPAKNRKRRRNPERRDPPFRLKCRPLFPFAIVP